MNSSSAQRAQFIAARAMQRQAHRLWPMAARTPAVSISSGTPVRPVVLPTRRSRSLAHERHPCRVFSSNSSTSQSASHSAGILSVRAAAPSSSSPAQQSSGPPATSVLSAATTADIATACGSSGSDSSSSSSSSSSSGSSSGSTGFPPPSTLVRLLTTLSLVPIFVFFLDEVASVETVRGTSMQPTLNPTASRWGPRGRFSSWKDDRVLLIKTNLFNKGETQQPRRGQVAVLRSARDPRQSTIKRIVGVEGDWVRTLPRPRDDHDEEAAWFSGGSGGRNRFLDDHPQHSEWIRVPPGRLWVEGDNALTSTDDSRQWGPLPAGLLVGRVTHILWPPNRFGTRLDATLEPAGGADRRVRPTTTPL